MGKMRGEGILPGDGAAVPNNTQSSTAAQDFHRGTLGDGTRGLSQPHTLRGLCRTHRKGKRGPARPLCPSHTRGAFRIIIGDKNSGRTSGSFPFCRPLGDTRGTLRAPIPIPSRAPHPLAPQNPPSQPRDRPGMDKPSPSPSSASPPVTRRSLPGWAGQLRGARARQEPPDPPKSPPMGSGGAPKRGLAGPGSCVQHLPFSCPSAGMGIKAREP